jgi:hypothetical protein
MSRPAAARRGGNAEQPRVSENALRLLARWLVRAHRAKGDPVANAPRKGGSSALTVAPEPSPHHGDEAA